MAKVVLYAPPLEEMGKALAGQIGAESAHSVFWDAFPGASSEKDPNIKVHIEAVKDRHVILLLSQDETTTAFAQLSLVLWLQRFYVPKPIEEHAKGKWKMTIGAGAFDVCSVASLTVVIPWYRYCQMDRSCRWTQTAEQKWDNSQADGPFVDVATAHMYASLLSADPPPPPGEVEIETLPPLPPKELLLIDIHDDLNGLPLIESTLRKTGKWANPSIPYNPDIGQGTYFTSAFEYFLRNTYKQKVTDVALCAVVFPDKGAYRRFHTMVERSLNGIAKENVLFIEKKRVGTEIEQSAFLNYIKDGQQLTRDSLPPGTAVLIPDDFTNSGSTLFGGAKIVRSKISGESTVAAFVTHFLAKYEIEVVNKFVAQLYSEGSTTSDLNAFYTTDSIPVTVNQLVKQGELRVSDGKPQRIFVTSLAPIIGEWVASRPSR